MCRSATATPTRAMGGSICRATPWERQRTWPMATLSSIDSGLPFGDFRALIERLPPLDERGAARVRGDFGRIEKPKKSHGGTEEVAAWLAASTGRQPAVLRPVVAIFAGNHGIA